MQSGFDINELLQAAQTRWLKPAEVLFILQNHANYEITQEAPQKPPSGSLFLFNKRVLRFFRKDGHSWRKKKDGRTVGEAHERLKVGNAEALNCYYAHGDVNPSFQRRSYWMLDPAYDHIVLVHYREISEGKLSSGSIPDLSSGTSSVFNQSPSACTQNPGSTSMSDVNGSYQSHSSPGSVEVNSNSAMEKGFDLLNGSNLTVNSSMLTKSEVSQALRRLEVQLSLEDDETLKNFPPIDDQDASEDILSLDDIYDSGYAREESNSIGSSLQLSGGIEMQRSASMTQSAENGQLLSWSDVLDLYQDPLYEKAQEEEGYILNSNVKELSSSGRSVEPEKHQLQHFGAHITGKRNEAGKTIDDLAYSSQIYSATPELSSLTLDPSLEMCIGTNSSFLVPILPKESRFIIHEISPEWGFTNESTKVFIIGSVLCDPSKSEFFCMFGDIEVPLQFVQNGVFSCQTPPYPSSGKVTLTITSSNHDPCSERREFEYRDKHTCTTCDKNKGEKTRNTDEMLLLVRLVQMLLSDSNLQNRENNISGFDLQKCNADKWNQIIESLLVGSATTSETLDWVLEQLLKDKLEKWISSRSVEGGRGGRGRGECCLSKKEQGIIHMIAGLGYEWALNPILGCGVGINFRDINGWTALHWAARFGREKMVAALIASGASAGALTDPSSHDPNGRNAAFIASINGHKGLAGYLSELTLTTHLLSLTLEESELFKPSTTNISHEELTLNNTISKDNFEDQISLKQTLAAVRNAAQAAARIQAAFRAHSFRKRQNREVVYCKDGGCDVDEYGFTINDLQGLSGVLHNVHDHHKAALSIQKNYRGWKGRKDFLSLRQKVVKIQAHVRGYQVRKHYRVICWAVGVLDKVVLRWRRKGAGLRGYKPEPDSVDENDDDDDIIKAFRKEKVNVAIDEAVNRVQSMVESPEARQQYHRMLGRFQEAKAELQGLTSSGASGSQDGVSAMDNDDVTTFL